MESTDSFNLCETHDAKLHYSNGPKLRESFELLYSSHI